MTHAIHSVLIANESGNPLYSISFGHRQIDDTLVLAFFSALKMFANSFIPNSPLKSIQIGNVSLDFDTADFEEIGKLDVLIISEGFDDNTSHAIINEITEQFAIYLDQKRNENPIIILMMQKGQFPNLRDFDKTLEQIIADCQPTDSIPIDMRISIPVSILNSVQAMFKIKPELAETYDNQPNALLEQIFTEYSSRQLDKELKLRWKTTNH